MAKLTLETARRSLAALLDGLPADAAVEIVKVDQRPAPGAAVGVRIEVRGAEPEEIKTATGRAGKAAQGEPKT